MPVSILIAELFKTFDTYEFNDMYDNDEDAIKEINKDIVNNNAEETIKLLSSIKEECKDNTDDVHFVESVDTALCLVKSVKAVQNRFDIVLA